MIGNWPSVPCSTPLCSSGCLEHEPQHRHEHQQQREQRDEPVVGDQRGKLAGLVVAELLDDRCDERAAGAPAGGGPTRADGRWGSSRLPGRFARAARRRRCLGSEGCRRRSGATCPVATDASRAPGPAPSPRRRRAGRLDPAEEVALVAHAARGLLLSMNRRRLSREDLEDCYSQATVELVAQARGGELRCSAASHLRNTLELRFASRIVDRRRALGGRSPAQATLDGRSRWAPWASAKSRSRTCAPTWSGS